MTQKIFVSSANNSTGLDTIDGISFTNIMNSRGPSTEPWGTPLVTGMVEDLWPLSTTCCTLLDKKLSIHFSTFP